MQIVGKWQLWPESCYFVAMAVVVFQVCHVVLFVYMYVYGISDVGKYHDFAAVAGSCEPERVVEAPARLKSQVWLQGEQLSRL